MDPAVASCKAGVDSSGPNQHLLSCSGQLNYCLYYYYYMCPIPSLPLTRKIMALLCCC